MITPLLLTTLPTLLFYFLLEKSNLFKSSVLKLSFAWCLGQYISTFFILIFAIFLNLFTSSVLKKASSLYLVLLILSFIPLKRELKQFLSLKEVKIQSSLLPKTIAILFCFIFPFFLFNPQLAHVEDKIYTSPIFWDFNIHFPIIQNFVYGDNFPPQNESFSNVPMTYHYFFDLLTAIYAASGLGLVGSINFISILSFSFLLISFIGFGEEIFNSTATGFIAVLLTLTSSSLRFIDYFSRASSLSLITTIKSIFTNTQHPFFSSFVEGNPFGYKGFMFDIFYFVAERQLIFGVLFLIFSSLALYSKKLLSNKACFLLGLLMGLFFQWHLFISIIIGLSILFLFCFSNERSKTFWIGLGFGVLFISQVFYFKSLLKPEWFYPDISDFPKISFDFPTFLPDYPFSLMNALGYYLYAYGLKIIFILLGFFMIFKKNKSLFILLISIILPAFILVNTVQLSPLSIYDNHKWLRPMNVIIDLIVAMALYKLFFQNRQIIWKIIGLSCFIFLTISGLMELMPFVNSKPSNLYASYPSEFIREVRENSHPQSSFLSLGSKELHLAGRKLFLGSSHDEPGATSILDSNRFNKALRERTIQEIYAVQKTTDFCQLVLSNNIDYVEFNSTNKDLPIYKGSQGFSSFSARNEKGELITFIKAKEGCHLFEVK